MQKKRSSFTGSIGFVLAAAGSAVGLGNIWRFPYLAARNGGGIFLLTYLVLALTFGFTLLTTEITIGRKTRQGPLTAYGRIHARWKSLGWLACLIPAIILPYYCAIGGWVLKYAVTYLAGQGAAAAEDGFFTGFITAQWSPIGYMTVFMAATALVIFLGVDKGIERLSRILMPMLLVMVVIICVFSLSLKHDDGTTVRTGIEGFKVYVIPDFTGFTLSRYLTVVVDAMGQLFYSLSVAMGIMVAYGSYVPKDADIGRSINQIELFDTLIAFLAGMMLIPAVYTFMGMDGLSSSGPGLIFVSLPHVFSAMGSAGKVIGPLFFFVVIFAALTSCISIMEAVVASIIDMFTITRRKATTIVTAGAFIVALIVCLGYNVLYFECPLPNGSIAQVLDILDYASNSVLMPIVGIFSCILIGWVVKPEFIIDEVESNGRPMGRRRLYRVMVRYITPVLLLMILLRSLGIL